MIFLDFLFQLRDQGLPVGAGEWLTFLSALRKGLIHDSEGIYRVGRSILCRSERDYDAFDLAFGQAFEGLVLPEEMREQLMQWLSGAEAFAEGGPAPKEYSSIEELIQDFLERLRNQKERHDGGNTWIGTGGTSAFGHGGRAPTGIRVGGPGGGGRAMRVAGERRWQNYRSDVSLDIRQIQAALRALRSLTKEGPLELDIDETVAATARQAGDIELVETRAKQNQLRVVLLMDAGGSMAPHAERVNRLFSAMKAMKTFKSLDVWYFHNCPYGHLFKDYQEYIRVPTQDVLAQLTLKHRLIFVGDASMAPPELFAAWGWSGSDVPSGLDWLRRFRTACPGSIWLNPDPVRWWNHPTVSAIGQLFPMFELTVEGLEQGVRALRRARTV